MALLQRILFFLGSVLAIGFAIAFGAGLLIMLLIAGGLTLAYIMIRQFLLGKGILNPTPGVRPEAPDASVTIIEGEFEQVENPMVRSSDETKQ